MKQLYVDLTVCSPLSIRSDHATSGAGATNYIPGHTLLGSLASTHRLLYDEIAEKQAEFERIFLSGKVHFANLYPAHAVEDTNSRTTTSDLPIYPMPKTAQSCKRFSGFISFDTKKDKSHGVRDSLVDWALFNLSGKAPAALANMRLHKNCTCGETMDHIGGYYRRGPGAMSLTKADTRVQTHTGINRASGTVQDGILYTREGFIEGERFWGSILFFDEAEDLAPVLKQFLTEVSTAGLMHMGTGRTRGMGQVLFKAEELPATDYSFFQERLRALDQLIQVHEEVKQAHPGSFFFALTLHSPLILKDEFLRYRLVLDGTTLQKELEVHGLKNAADLKLECIYHTAQVQRVTGWQELWGTPRIHEYAIETGSVFLFKSSLPLNDGITQALYSLEVQGMGQRRAEGFGRVCVSDAFHQEVEQR